VEDLFPIYNNIIYNRLTATDRTSSSEIISCKECEQHFDTIDALREHEKSEQQDKELQNKGL
jgi:hypothetical protein